MKLKELRNVLDYNSLKTNLWVLQSEGNDIKIEYDRPTQFMVQEDFNDYEITSILVSQYSIDIYVAKEGG